jgi:parallel beta-helix repeat protein
MKSLGNLATIILIGAIILSSFTLISGTQASVGGNITTNTTWTKADSPYMLTGNVTVDSGATLTIEPGVTIQIPSDCTLQINGTLVARGTSSEKISFIGGDVSLSGSRSGSVIENSILNPTNLIIGSSATINDNTIIGRGSANSFEAVLINEGAPSISNNLIYGADSQRGMRLTGGSPTISSNGIMGMIISEGNNVGTTVISHNTIEGGIHLSQSGATITNNLITGFKYVNFNGDVDSLYSLIYESWLGSGISITADYENIQHGAGAVITDNVITGCEDGISVLQGGTTSIQRNLIVNTSRVALHVASDAIISDNTIRNNQKGIVVSNAPTLTVKNNNLENNGYNFYLYTGNNIDATNNWWGTTDTQTIENNIYDGKFKQYSGNVTTTPILTAPNPEAHPNSMAFPSINMPNSGDSENNPFHIGTNSTVTDVAFNPENTTLSFTVSGPSGTVGSTNVTLAKSIMPNGGALKVTMDDKQISYALADNGDSWNLGFTYIHSTHRVVITDGVNQSQPTQTPTSAVDEFNILPIALFFIIALAALSLIIVGLKRKKSYYSKFLLVSLLVKMRA